MAKIETASGLKPLYSFEELVIGTHNQVAVGACMEVVKSPGDSYNPLFIYGPPGVGKTHMMQAVAHQLLVANSSFKVRYISAERFMNEILMAISEDRMLEVRRQYSTLDMLMIDDVQYMTESKISQEELFHIFNNLHQGNRQVILASDRPPNQLTTLNKNIRSRLEWGLSVDIRVPDEPTRVLILKRKQAHSQGLNMTDEMFTFVARNLKSNVRELEGFLKRIHAYVTLSHQLLTMDLVKSVVKEILPEGTPEVTASESSSPVKNGSLATAQLPEVKSVMPPSPMEPPVLPPPPPPTQFSLPPISVPPTPVLQNEMPFDVMLDSIDLIQVESTPPPPPPPALPKKTAPMASPPPPPVSSPPPPPPPPVPVVAAPVPSTPEPEPEVEEISITEDDLESRESDAMIGLKEIGAVFFFPEGRDEELKSVSKKFQEVIRKHKLKFRLKAVHNQPYAYKGKVNFTSFVDVCKANRVPVAIVIGPPPDNLMPQQDFYDLLTVTLDVQGVSLQLINWSEINKDYRYLNLALDIALVRSR